LISAASPALFSIFSLCFRPPSMKHLSGLFRACYSLSPPFSMAPPFLCGVLSCIHSVRGPIRFFHSSPIFIVFPFYASFGCPFRICQLISLPLATTTPRHLPCRLLLLFFLKPEFFPLLRIYFFRPRLAGGIFVPPSQTKSGSALGTSFSFKVLLKRPPFL